LRHISRRLHDHPSPRPCKDETRFQGIATPGRRAAPARGPQEEACKDETRFQGIATTPEESVISTRMFFLARTRPVFRGLRLLGQPVQDHPDVGHPLQGRDPFSGDCDRIGNMGHLLSEMERLQGRDPFSGDCDLIEGASMIPQRPQEACKDETRFQGIATWCRARR
jgi:hypothetical protein